MVISPVVKGVMGDPKILNTAINSQYNGPSWYIPPQGVAPPPATPTPQPQGNLPPSWYNPHESEWQNALDQAEQYRNYNNAYSHYAEDQTNWINSQGQPYNGSMAGDHQVNWDKFQAPNWNGPDAYGLSGIQSGQKYQDENQANEYLQRIKQFDPNAQLVQSSMGWGGEGATDQPAWELQFDQSKLPKLANSQADTLAGPYGHDHLYNNNNGAMLVDPHYGIMTNSRNIREDQGPGWFRTLGIAAPAILAMMTGGMGALPGLLMKAPGILSGLANGQGLNPFQLASLGIPFIPGMNPFLAGLSRVGLQAADQARRGG